MTPPVTTYRRNGEIVRRVKGRKGLGDMIAIIATPIARVFRLKCVNKKTGRLRPGSRCDRRKLRLNQITHGL